jgi:acylphosphatase
LQNNFQQGIFQWPRMKAVYGVVRGMVQGVGFRFFTRKTASRLGVAGWVRNRDDGSVEFFAQAGEKTMAEFLAAVRQGPFGGTVETMDLDDAEADPGLKVFEIRF